MDLFPKETGRVGGIVFPSRKGRPVSDGDPSDGPKLCSSSFYLGLREGDYCPLGHFVVDVFPIVRSTKSPSR